MNNRAFTEDDIRWVLGMPLGTTTIGNLVCAEVTADKLIPAMVSALNQILCMTPPTHDVIQRADITALRASVKRELQAMIQCLRPIDGSNTRTCQVSIQAIDEMFERLLVPVKPREVRWVQGANGHTHLLVGANDEVLETVSVRSPGDVSLRNRRFLSLDGAKRAAEALHAA